MNINQNINNVDYNDTRTFKVWNYKYLDDTPENIIIYALAILTGDYDITRKRASILLLRALIKKDFLQFVLDNPELYPSSRLDNRVLKWTKQIKSKGRCERCGSKENLEAHHIIEWSEYPQGRIDLNNGMCLCLKCHTEEHKFDKSYYMMKTKLRKKVALYDRCTEKIL